MEELNPRSMYRPPLTTGDEKALLGARLRLVQQALLWKVADLSDEELRRPMTPTGTNLIGIVKHLTGITSGYLCSAFGRPRETFDWETDEELFFGLDMWATPEESPAEIIAAYRRACDAAAESIEALDLDATGTHHTGATVSLRWMILNVLMDTARHAGHADVVREELDGRVGSNPVTLNTAPLEDEEAWAMYRARMSGEIDKETYLAWHRSRPGYDPAAWEAFVQRTRGPANPG